ncbi:hypothetical protein X801_09568 [Opisthorchis viverrini]|uniref:Uncharacterized protein n=1 Tax=Opisthorchis viverrini TaxID=6198 RepID=A0A1S8WJL4_OPIVI|nr:hypothetical protein X801_09568 [Opisthorchis viverrini]
MTDTLGGLFSDPNEVAPVYTVPGTDLVLVTADTLQDREDMLGDFVKRCKGIIEVGLQWAPSLDGQWDEVCVRAVALSQ